MRAMQTRTSLVFPVAVSLLATAACGDDGTTPPGATPRDPDTSPVTSVDRFLDGTATLMVRTAQNGMPAANAPVDFDTGPFITQGLGPDGSMRSYYNFDVQPVAPANIYVFFRDGESMPMAGQLNVINVKPGDAGYSDFWRVVKVNVDAGYRANTLTSEAAIIDSGFELEPVPAIVNCPVVSAGSTARKRVGGGAATTMRGWYRDTVVHYFSFEEAPLALAGATVPTSPIFVTFNVNPDQPNGGPPSGFRAEANGRTHNVLGSLPGQPAYSPLWSVSVYDNADFAQVTNLATAQAARILGNNVMNVNCPLAE
jgi:hypothetical protein